MATTSLLEGNPATSLGLEDELGSKRLIVDNRKLSFCTVEVVQGRDSLWIVAGFEGNGGFALRAGYLPGNGIVSVESKGDWSYEVIYPSGKALIQVSEGPDSSLRVRTSIKPSENLIIPYIPRDFYPINADGDPTEVEGSLHTSQAGLAAPMVYLSLEKPRVGSFFYHQNLTALNGYFELTDTSPEGSVGGKWPELGYLPPTSSDLPLPANKYTLVSDSIVAFNPEIPKETSRMCQMFLDFLAVIHGQIEKPPIKRQDWIGLSEKSLKDLSAAPTASVTFWGCKFLRPYNDAENPDCMVQANILHGLFDYGRWLGKKIPLATSLKKGMSRFYDRDLKTIRRYLPNVGKDKDKDEVDSWYMYHPLMSLARLARDGETWAEKLFFDSLETAIGFARKFKNRWPVMFHLVTGEVIREQRRENEPGQSDVAGLYAYVMMQAFELSGDKRYLQEAKNSVKAVQGMGFELAYQLNTTAWGVPACLRLFKETGEEIYLEQAMVFLAAFMRHMIHWESDIKLAKEFSTFMGVLCLDDTRYMALFECHESFEAFWEALSLANEDLPESARVLMADYNRHALHRAWYYYPKFLPKDGLSEEVRNGKIDTSLHFPLEDLYPDGQPAGQVGQEVYGCGGSFAFATHAFHRIERAPFLLYCDCAIRQLECSDRLVSFEVAGSALAKYRLEVIPTSTKSPHISLFSDQAKSTLRSGEPVDVAGNSSYTIQWRTGRTSKEFPNEKISAR